MSRLDSQYSTTKNHRSNLKLLNQDKCLLAQEKAQLEGQLKQFQVSLTNNRMKDKNLIEE